MEDDDDVAGGGTPVEELATLFEPPPDGLHERVRSSIHRRLLAADVADLSFRHVVQAAIEFVKMVFEAIGSGRTQDEDPE